VPDGYADPGRGRKRQSIGIRKRRLSPLSNPLTTRRREIVKLIAEGASSKEIADPHCRKSPFQYCAKTEHQHTANLIKHAIRKGDTLSTR
jgi:FixJ family two-component response regulator